MSDAISTISSAVQPVGDAISSGISSLGSTLGLNSAADGTTSGPLSSISNIFSGGTPSTIDPSTGLPATAAQSASSPQLLSAVNGSVNANVPVSPSLPSTAPASLFSSSPTPNSGSSGNFLSSLFGPSNASLQAQQAELGINQSAGQAFNAAGDSVPMNSPDAVSFGTSAPGVISGASGNGIVGSPLASVSSGGAPQQGSTLTNVLKLVASLGPLVAAIHPTTYPGTQTQSQVQNQLSQQAANTQANNAGFISALNNAGSMNRQPLQPNIDYYTYGSRPEQLFYGNVNPPISFPTTNTAPVSFAKGGKVQKMAQGGQPLYPRQPVPNVRGLNNGAINPRGIRGGIQNPLIPGGGQVRLMASGGSPLNAASYTPAPIPQRPMYNPAPVMSNQTYQGRNMAGVAAPSIARLPSRAVMTGAQLPGSNGRLMMAAGGNVNGGQQDNIPTQLSEGEFVMPADVTSSLGDGNTDAGAKQLHNLITQVRKHKASKMGAGKLPPQAKSPLAYMQQGA